ncbi:MAG: hypothetical protein Kow0032_09410 [Methyloligellaceae bacterium]
MCADPRLRTSVLRALRAEARDMRRRRAGQGREAVTPRRVLCGVSGLVAVIAALVFS